MLDTKKTEAVFAVNILNKLQEQQNSSGKRRSRKIYVFRSHYDSLKVHTVSYTIGLRTFRVILHILHSAVLAMGEEGGGGYFIVAFVTRFVLIYESYSNFTCSLNRC